MISVKGATRIFNRGKENEVVALDDVCLEVARGECAVLSGPSGSGKTTLLGIVGCVSPPTSGSVSIAGKEVSRLPEKFLTLFRREHIGIIFQFFNLVNDLSAIANVYLPHLPKDVGISESEGKAQEVMRKLEIHHKAMFKVREISGGEQQRVAIARALMNDPQIILADEPTAHLDTHLSRELFKVLSGLKEEGRTVIIASHDPMVVEQGFVDVVFEMRDGKVVNEVRK